ncbi:MAG TPA: glutamate synthase-related protein, partial [Candidatus Limnocylindrales bacterium]|nr:glutamate synthase-related protein [Candidatus Limnocylindrales bacterium]
MTERASAQPAPQRTKNPPLYDERYEHDACGVGFVADGGGRSRARVLPLALAGLAALGHRGAFAADGESSDGAGVLLPLDPSVVRLLDPKGVAGDRPGVVSAFLPRGRLAAIRGRELLEAALAVEGLAVGLWRTVPTRLDALGTEARATAPGVVQALVARPTGLSDEAFELALICARRRAEGATRAEGLAAFSISSASPRTVVYKGLVSGGRLPDLFPDLRAELSLPFVVFHQRYATNTHPVWALAQPFARIAHNGEIDTVRGGREAVRGRASDRGVPGHRSAAARRLLAAGPLLSPGGSDSRSLDEALELLVGTGWSLEAALLALVPEAQALRRAPHPLVASFGRRTAGFLAPWDGPAALVFADGRRVGALLDRNGLRPLAFAITRDRLVAAASEAGAVPLDPGEIVRAGRLAPGELLLVDPGARRVYEDAEAKAFVLRHLPVHDEPRIAYDDRTDAIAAPEPPTPVGHRFLFGVDAEKLRQDVRTMTVEAHEPLWSMGDDTPLTGRARVDRPASDHLRQAFAQVTNPPIDPEREKVVLDLRVELGRRPALLGGLPAGPSTLRLARPVIADLDALLEAFRSRGAASGSLQPGDAPTVIAAGRPDTPTDELVLTLDATWSADDGPGALDRALSRLATESLEAASRHRTQLLVLSDRAASPAARRLPVPAVLAAGAVHTALTNAGYRGRLDIVVDAAELLDVHGVAMTLACGATAVHPRLLVELAIEQAGSRGAEELAPAGAIDNLLAAIDAGLRKILARMGISTMASYIGGQLFETLELGPAIVARCFPAAAAWPGRIEAADLARIQLRRLEAALAIPDTTRPDRLPDPGLTRYRADGEFHVFNRPAAMEIQALANGGDDPRAALARYREALRRDPAVIRDGWRVVTPRDAHPIPTALVEPALSITRRFVVSAMSVGALSPEAHRALTLGIQSIGGSANTGEGGEDPAWYAPGPDGRAHDAKIKQVASARFGVSAQYLARAEQLEIKIAQGSKPGEGGQLPGRKATAYIASLRRAQPGQSLISPPPHHDIYSIEDLAQLIADLRAINPRARIGVKLVATRGVGTIAAGVAKAGADYVHLSGHSGGTGASPLSSIKHVGAPWELGLAEVHQ